MLLRHVRGWLFRLWFVSENLEIDLGRSWVNEIKRGGGRVRGKGEIRKVRGRDEERQRDRRKRGEDMVGGWTAV